MAVGLLRGPRSSGCGGRPHNGCLPVAANLLLSLLGRYACWFGNPMPHATPVFTVWADCQGGGRLYGGCVGTIACPAADRRGPRRVSWARWRDIGSDGLFFAGRCRNRTALCAVRKLRRMPGSASNAGSSYNCYIDKRSRGSGAQSFCACRRRAGTCGALGCLLSGGNGPGPSK